MIFKALGKVVGESSSKKSPCHVPLNQYGGFIVFSPLRSQRFRTHQEEKDMNIFLNETVLQRLATIIEESGYQTKKEFCQAMGISPASLSDILSSKRRQEITKSLMLGLVKNDYNLKWLFWGIGEKKN